MTNFNPAPPLVMHIDFNSCFASIEQQANPLLRGKPVVVAAYASPKGCILAASREAKAMGRIKTGMQVQQARTLIPNLIVLEPDSMKYRTAHRALYKLLLGYTSDVEPKSIDEFVCHFQDFKTRPDPKAMALEIKSRIKSELGEYLTVSIGFGPNRFLAKQAAIFKKPDGLEIINQTNFLNYYSNLRLTDLNGIAGANEHRLNWQGIYSVADMYTADLHKLKRAFGGIVGYYWYLRLRGYEIDRVIHKRSMFGSIYSLPTPVTTFSQTIGMLTKLVEKAALRMQKDNFSARSMSLWLNLKNKTAFHQVQTLKEPLFSSLEIIKQASLLLQKYNFGFPINKISFSLFNLEETKNVQYELFADTDKALKLAKAVVDIKIRWGTYGLTLANMLDTQSRYKDIIGFGNIKDIDYELSPEFFSTGSGPVELPEETW